MWFSSVYFKSLRDFRIAILGWGLGIGLLMFTVLAAVSSVLSTAAARASLVSLASSFNWIAEPIKVDTPGGYATWKYGFTILLICLWPLLVGSRMLRGEEERGSLDVLLTMPRARARVALEKLAAMWTALLAMALLIGLFAFGGGKTAKVDLSLGDTLLFGLNLALICAVFGGIALLISQFTQERGTAAGITGALLLISIVVDTVHRVIPGTDWFSRISPVYYYNLSKPLVPGYGTDPVALLILLALAVVTSGTGVALFARRDVGGTVALPRWLRLPQRAMRPESALPANAWSLRSIYTRSLARIARPTVWWTIGLAAFAGWMIVIVQQTVKQLTTLFESSPTLQAMFKTGAGSAVTDAGILSALYVFLPLLMMAFAITQASSWSSDEENGRLELVLSTPQPRLRVLLGRFAAVATSVVIVSVVTLAVAALAAKIVGLSLDGGNLAAATLSIIPLGLLVLALGYLLAGWLNTAIDTGLLSFLLLLWFFISFVGPGLNWSNTSLRFSALYYYGTPILNGLPVRDTLAVLAVAAVALALASVRFMRKDIGR